MSVTEVRTIMSDNHYNLKIQDVRHLVSHDPDYQQLYEVIIQWYEFSFQSHVSLTGLHRAP